jgi:predicted transcriptional regulator
MASGKRLIPEFYDLKVSQLIDKRVWDLPIVEKNEDIQNVLNILGGRNHIWVVEDKKNMKLIGIITEHDVLSILAPKEFSLYMFGMPDLRSIQHGTVKTAENIMQKKVISCQCNDKIGEVLNKMTTYGLRRLPVIENNKIIGQITLHQLIRKYYDATQYNPIVDEEK